MARQHQIKNKTDYYVTAITTPSLHTLPLIQLGMYWQLGILGTISAFVFRHRETKKNLFRGERSQEFPNTDF